MMKKVSAIAIIAGFVWLTWQNLPWPIASEWSDEELALISSLSLHKLPELKANPSNAVAASETAARLGQSLFFDANFSGAGAISCATCHQPERFFTDGSQFGRGTALGDRNTPSIVGIAYSPWFYWDGRKDSLWSQALEPLENPLEHGGDRMAYVRMVLQDPEYLSLYQEAFGEIDTSYVNGLRNLDRFPPTAMPNGSSTQQAAWQAMSEQDREWVNSVFANLGKALAAYERKIVPGLSRFDHYVTAAEENGRSKHRNILSASETAGLKLFIGKAACINCHNGPLLTNHAFHNTGLLSLPAMLPSIGRIEGVRIALNDEFNCSGKYSDSEPSRCFELRFALQADELIGAHKTPTLRNISETAPYMHGGQLATLAEVVEHYDVAEEAMIGHNEAEPLNLRAVEKRQLVDFLNTLSAPLGVEPALLRPPQ